MMSGGSLVDNVHELMLAEFRAVPFHNLFYLGLCEPNVLLPNGSGTCSDKVLAFRQRLLAEGIPARLHHAMINGQICHRVLALELDGARYFADVGNGWPSVQLFPADREVSYVVYGIEFSSVLNGGWLDVYHNKHERKTLSVRIPLVLPDERQVLQQIKDRFDGRTAYPFTDGFRFAQVRGDQFLFLKRNTLRVYQSDHALVTHDLPDRQAQLLALETYFGVSGLERCFLPECDG